MKNLDFLGLFVSCIIAAFAQIASAGDDKVDAKIFQPQKRETSEAMTSAFCAVATDETLLWQAGIFDAQVEASRMRGFTKITDAEGVDRARALAQTFHYGSYAGGACPDGSGWAAAFPAPKPVQVTANRILISDARRCKGEQVEVRFAATKGGDSEKLEVRSGIVDVAKLDAGFVSVTCRPSSPNWAGPEEWYLIPVGSVGDGQAPHEETLVEPVKPESIVAWVNGLRRDAGRPAIALSEELNEAARTIGVSAKVQHDMKTLSHVGQELKEKKGLILQGEDRVRSRSIVSSARLLWRSPPHRDLLLNRDAALFGVKLEKVGKEYFVGIVMGRPLAEPQISQKNSQKTKEKK